MCVRQVLLLYTVRWKMDDDTLLMTMMFDFFGDLLTEKQREYFDLYHNEDLSLSEIAEKAGISRQGVYDIIARAGKSLAEMEHKTGLVKRWLDIRAELEQAEEMALEIIKSLEEKPADLARRMILKLEGIKGFGI